MATCQDCLLDRKDKGAEMLRINLNISVTLTSLDRISLRGTIENLTICMSSPSVGLLVLAMHSTFPGAQVNHGSCPVDLFLNAMFSTYYM